MNTPTKDDRNLYCANCGDDLHTTAECERPRKSHYHYGAGLHGYLYQDGPYYADTLQEAVDALAESYGLGRTRKAELKRNHSLELNLRRDGNEYCEIIECSDDCSEEDYE